VGKPRAQAWLLLLMCSAFFRSSRSLTICPCPFPPILADVLGRRLMDAEDAVRRAAVVAIADAAMEDPLAVDTALVRKCGERLRDKKVRNGRRRRNQELPYTAHLRVLSARCCCMPVALTNLCMSTPPYPHPSPVAAHCPP